MLIYVSTIPGKAARRLTHVAPVEAPVDVGLREAGRLARDLHRAANHHGEVARGPAQNARLTAADLVAVVAAVVLAVAHEALEDTLVAAAAQELVRLAQVLGV